jgi:hypothetical protein
MPPGTNGPGSSGFPGPCAPFDADPPAPVVVICSVEVAALPLTSTPAGEKLQAAPAGNPEHAKLTF